MKNQDYNSIFEEELKAAANLPSPPTLLLHSCCGPCSSSVLERLCDVFAVTVFYSNSNVFPEEEYEKRVRTQLDLLQRIKPKHPVSFVEDDYLPLEWESAVSGLENEPEGGKRCEKCIAYRMEIAGNYAATHGFDYFTTTLSVSPHKNAPFINETGKILSEKFGVKFLFSDFKKKNGFLRSTQLSKEYGLYRQDYCGCRFSKWHD